MISSFDTHNLNIKSTFSNDLILQVIENKNKRYIPPPLFGGLTTGLSGVGLASMGKRPKNKYNNV